MTGSFFLNSLMGGLRLSTPLTYGALGGYFSERSGVINIGLEGMMLIGSFTSAAVAYSTHNPWLGVAAGAGGGLLLAAVHAFLSITLKADQIISGIAVNLLAAGIPPVVCKALYGQSGGTPLLANEMRVPAIAGLSPLMLFAFVLAFILWFVHGRTRFGQYVRFAGEHPQALASQGISAARVRWIAVLLSGALCGIAGAYLSIDHGGAFSRNMTAGRGFIALAALIIGRWTPLGAFAASLVFGLVETAQILLQGMKLPFEIPGVGDTVPVQWIQMVPYIATLVILAGVFVARIGRSRAPKALGQPLLIALCLFMLSGCTQLDDLRAKFFPPKSPEPSVPSLEVKELTIEQRKVNGAFLRELFKDVFERDAKEAEFNNLMNVLDQGGTYEGVYNGIVYSDEYRAREKGMPAAGSVHMYAEILTLILMDQDKPAPVETERPDVPKPEQSGAAKKPMSEAEQTAMIASIETDSASIPAYTLKKNLGEQLIRIVDLKKGYREKLASWYGKFAVALNAKGLDFGIEQRNIRDEGYHYRWALEAPEDRIKWECLNRIHMLMNDAMAGLASKRR